MELLDAVEQSKIKHRDGKVTINWIRVSELMGNQKTGEAYRSKYKRLIGQAKDYSKENSQRKRNIQKGIIDTRDIIIKEMVLLSR